MKMKKKGIAILLAALMCLGMIPTFGVLADEAPQNLVVNPGFEDVETRTVEGTEETYEWTKMEDGEEVWNPKDGYADFTKTDIGTEAKIIKATVEPNFVRSGNYSVRIQTDKTCAEYRRLWQKVEGLTGGKWYEASVWVKGVKEEGEYTTAPSHGFAADSRGLDMRVGKGINNGSINTNTANGWFASTGGPISGIYKFWESENWTQLMVRWQQPTVWDGDASFDSTVAYLVFDMRCIKNLTASFYFDDACVREITGFNGDFEEASLEKIYTDASKDKVLYPSALSMATFGSSQFVGLSEEYSVVEENGNHCLQIKPKETNYISRATLFAPNLVANGVYKLSAKIKITGTALTSGINIFPHKDEINTYSSAYNKDSATKIVDKRSTANQDWQEFSTVFTVPANQTYIIIESGKTSDNTTTIYIDDIKLIQADVTFTKGENTITATADYVNQDAVNATSAMLVVAVYAVDGTTKTLKEVGIVGSGDVAVKDAATFSTTVPYTDTSYEVKAMLYDGTMADLQPICSPFIYPKEA